MLQSDEGFWLNMCFLGGGSSVFVLKDQFYLPTVAGQGTHSTALLRN